jgi:hypothetical protein
MDEMNSLQAVARAIEGIPPQPGGLRFPPNAKQTARTAVIHDLRRDWRRWTTTERALASVIMALLICTSATILMTASGFLPQVLK